MLGVMIDTGYIEYLPTLLFTPPGERLAPDDTRSSQCKTAQFSKANICASSADRYVRSYFYGLAADAALEAVVLCSSGVISNRMKLQVMFPEMNPQMDSYRIGTLLELVNIVYRCASSALAP